MTEKQKGASEDLLARIRKAAAQGAMEGYRRVLEEFRANGPAR